MAKDSPFLLFKVECPICKTINEFELIRVGAYSEEGRDTDFCPNNVEWRSPRYQGYNPLVFFTATCSNCYYTREFTNNFKDWKNDNYFRTYRLKQVKSKHLEQLSTADSVVKTMGDAIDIHGYPNESAILKLLLAIYDEYLADHTNKLDLGRLFLRTAWVFRDMTKGEDPRQQHLHGLMYELDNKYGMLSQTVSAAETETNTFADFMKSHFESDQVAAGIKSRMLAFEDRYSEQITDLRNCLSSAQVNLSEMNDLIGEYKTAIVGSSSDSSSREFGAHPSFEAFLLSIRKAWPQAVTNEHEALEKAIENYKAAFVSGREISPGPQQIQASYLIAELSRRVGDHEEAKQYFNSTIKNGQEFIYQNRSDRSRTALARKILELAIEQGKANLAEAKTG
jgi:uncharacterized protein (DUF2225 family)